MVKNSIELSPSILGADASALGDAVLQIKNAGLKWVHLDIMDAHFVPNLSFGPAVLASLKKRHPDMFYDVHLMMDNPHLYIDAFANAGAGSITVHTEPDYPIHETLQEIHLKGCKVGITIKPKTSVYDLCPFLPFVDMVLLMSVEPGFGGQSFMEGSYERIAAVAKMREEAKLNFRIEIDGGITGENVGKCIEHGVDTIVAGTEFFKHGDALLAVIAPYLKA